MEQKHSELGIASFITSIVAGVPAWLINIIGAAMILTPGGKDEEYGAEYWMFAAALSLLGLLFVCFVALTLGIGGLTRKDRKKTFAIRGIAVSAVTLVGTISVWMLILRYADN